ncbi:tripartite motif-containing protein 16-like protein [Megalops cyprinoides]|uniref:tripartite motif-containing protein 16-like protein n=1 Tax=Megalops cyprinoides TaxID=118141 RepID=UPI001864A804|nr:tripartite motif-containing protein 16-like protein [Megalops cyprinoides]
MDTDAEIPAYDPNVAEPTCRADLLKYWINLSLDERTAQKTLWVSDDGSKVSRMTEEVCPYLERPERYELTPQVLCKESLWGRRGYWEVKCAGWVIIGATYAKVGRKAYDGPCGLGENDESWGLGWAGSCYHAWHKGNIVEIQGVPYCPTLGVYLDQPAGIISFYAVEGKQEGGEGTGKKEVKPLYKFQAPMVERILPGIWVGRMSSCLIMKKEE